MLHVVDDETQFDANLGRQVMRAGVGVTRVASHV